MLRKLVHLTGRTRHPAKKKSRNGGMLLLVVIIMAIALILITSALTITTASRNRYYDSALTGQATITATSVAKTIGAAVEKGDITLAELEALASANGGAGTLVPVTSAASATKTSGSAGSNPASAVAPGLYNDTSRSYTTVLIKNFTSPSGKVLVQIKATTGLDVNGNATSKAETESVFLEKITPAPPAGAFSGLVNCGAPGSWNNFSNVVIGTKPAGQATGSNYIVLNGNLGISASGGGQKIYSDVIFTGQLTTGAGDTYTGNIVFYGNKASLNATDSGGDGIQTTGKMLFLGDDPSLGTGQQSVFTNSAGTATTLNNSFGGMRADAGIYLYNTVMKYGLGWDFMNSAAGIYADNKALIQYTNNWYSTPNGNRVYQSTTSDLTSYYTPTASTALLTSRGGIYAAGGNDTAAFVTALKTEATNILSATMKTSISYVLPKPLTTPTFYTDFGIAYKTVAEVNAGATQLTSANLTGASGVYTNAAYYINAAATPYVGNDCTDGSCWYATQTELKFDLSTHDITVYIYGSGNTLYFGSGVFRFINGGVHIGRIVLMDGCNITLSQNNNSYDTGIIGTDHIASGTGTQTKVNFVAPLPKPYLYVLGINNNTISAMRYATIEGYVGLYGTNGKFYFTNNPYFYGRLECTNLDNTGGDPMTINYCPSPTESGGGGGAASPYYQINGYQAS
jgi:hypothetical protein